MFEKQGWHLIVLTLLLICVALLARGSVLAGSLWGIGTRVWLWIAVAFPIIHQIFVWLFWRLELHHGLITRLFGKNGFYLYKVGFTILFAARPISILLLGISDYNRLAFSPALMYCAAVLLLIPGVYTMYSVVRYFGMDRAYGIDHFEPSYRTKPFVNQGMFKYTDNAMYKFGFFILWSIALFTLSKAALLAAAFNHLYIWVHFYFTELPDIKHIYGNPSKEPV
jgi:hypothetical protein